MGGQKRVVILSSEAGFGHRSAARAIAAALEELYGAQCHTDIINPLAAARAPAILRNTASDYDRMVREMPDLYRLGYEASDAAVPSALVERALTMMLLPALRDMIKRYQPSVLVTTYPIYQAPLGAAMAQLRVAIPLFTVVTDLVSVHRLWFCEAADYTLVPTDEVGELALQAGLQREQVRVTGIPVSPQLASPVADRAALRRSLGLQPNGWVLLAVGSRRAQRLPLAIQAVNHSGLALQLLVVSGGDPERYAHYRATEWHLPSKVMDFAHNMPDLMHAADCILCKAGGLIVTEALACGLPMLLVDVIPGQETGNAAYVDTREAGVVCQDSLSVLETLCHWFLQDGAELAERARAARALGRPRAAYEVAELVYASAQREPAPRPEKHRWVAALLSWLAERGDSPADQGLRSG